VDRESRFVILTEREHFLLNSKGGGASSPRISQFLYKLPGDCANTSLIILIIDPTFLKDTTPLSTSMASYTSVNAQLTSYQSRDCNLANSHHLSQLQFLAPQEELSQTR
jgi:hypothetical protein